MGADVKRLCACVLARLGHVRREGPLSCLFSGLLASAGGYLFAPLGPAAVSAAWLMGKPGIWELGGAVIGSLIGGRWAALMNLSMLSALRLLSESRRRPRIRGRMILILCAGLLCAPFFYISSLTAAIAGAIHICCTLIFAAVFCRTGRALSRARMGRGIGEEDMTALLLTIGGVCCAASSIGYSGVTLGSMLAAAAALFSAGTAGIYSVAAAAVAGAGTVLGGGELAFVGALALGALAAAALSSLGRLPSCAAFAAICGLCGWWAGCTIQLAVPGITAALGCMLLPDRFHNSLKGCFRLGRSDAEHRLSALTGRVMDAALVLDRVSSLFEHSPQSEAELFAGKQLRCMSEAITSLPHPPRARPRYSLDCGMTSCPRQGSRETGDSMSIRELVGGKLVLLSDGMGSGPTARRESSTAVSLIGDLLSVGVEELDALDCVNRLLMAKGERDMYATMDAMTFNYHSGCARFLKLGAPPSYVLRGDRVIELCAETLPIGIVSAPEPASQEMQLCHGDMIFMLTDGITDSLGDQLVYHIGDCSGLSPQASADALLQAARHFGMGDDMSVIAIAVKFVKAVTFTPEK